MTTDDLDIQERTRPVTISATRGPRPPRRHYPLNVVRPVTRADCEGVVRPCSFVSCRHNLYLDVHPRTGGLKINFPHVKVGQLRPSCSLDVADQGGSTLEEVGAAMNITRERVRQLEEMALERVFSRLGQKLRAELRAHLEEVA